MSANEFAYRLHAAHCVELAERISDAEGRLALHEQTNKVAASVRINVSCCARSDKIALQMKTASQGAATPRI
jgi:hypothetical protein